jgi:hypothetical protein
MQKIRSANYPVLSLDEAIRAIAEIYKTEHRSRASREVLSRALGYSGVHGRSQRKLAALRAYGLLDGEGDELRVSEDGVTLIHAPDGATERSLALRRAALRPTLFRELYERFEGKVPSEENLAWELRKRGFTEKAVSKVVRVYIKTIELIPEDNSRRYRESAGESASDDVQLEANFDPASEAIFERAISRGGVPEQEVFATSLFGGDMVRITYNGEWRPEAIRRLIHLLEANRTVMSSGDQNA